MQLQISMYDMENNRHTTGPTPFQLETLEEILAFQESFGAERTKDHRRAQLCLISPLGQPNLTTRLTPSGIIINGRDALGTTGRWSLVRSFPYTFGSAAPTLTNQELLDWRAETRSLRKLPDPDKKTLIWPD